MKTEIKGIVADMANLDYHAHSALSSSGMKYMAKSPAHYREYRANPPEQTKAMMIGSAVHAGFLENGLSNGAVIKAPGSTRTTNIYKDFAKASHPSSILLLEDEFTQVEAIIAALRGNPTVTRLMASGEPEQSAFWNDPETGVLCKCRPDFLTDSGLVIDLKTTDDASPGAFQHAIGQFKYHWQSAWYLDGLSQILGQKLENFIHVVVEKEAPYAIGIYVLDDDSLSKARTDISRIKARYAECIRTDQWPGITTEIQNISIPAYEFTKEIA